MRKQVENNHGQAPILQQPTIRESQSATRSHNAPPTGGDWDSAGARQKRNISANTQRQHKTQNNVTVCKIDLLKGYWQIPLSPYAKEILLQYTIPFGLRNGLATSQRLINGVLEGIPYCQAFLDDLLIYSPTWPSQMHLSHLSTVFRRLTDANLTINLAKCKFSQATVLFHVGYAV